MEQVHSPDAAHEIASFRERLRTLRSRAEGITEQRSLESSKIRTSGRADQPCKPSFQGSQDAPWCDTQWNDTVFDSGDR
jgi:hypothetical protein